MLPIIFVRTMRLFSSYKVVAIGDCNNDIWIGEKVIYQNKSAGLCFGKFIVA